MAKRQEEQILQAQLTEAQAALRRSFAGLFISALSGGLDVGFSLFISASVLTALPGLSSVLLERLLVGGAYAIGFILVVIGRSELFTEQTASAVLPVLHRIADLRQLARLWAIVWAGNVIGAAAFGAFAVIIGPALGVIDRHAFDAVANHNVAPAWWIIILSGTLAGWLMGLLSWLSAASRDTMGQIMIVVVITGSLGFLGLHHSIVGTAEVMAGLLSGDSITLLDFGRFLGLATFGNAVGGVFFVAVLKYTHAIRPGPSDEVELSSEGN